ncbi:MAG: Hsp20/alpha crystallin family protein [Armatimonadota bacterium]
MEIMRWNPFEELRALQEEMNRLFEQRFTQPAQRREHVSTRVWSPPVDVYEDDDEIVLYVELAGMKQEDIHIELTSDTLTIKGERKFEDGDRRDKFIRVERPYGQFQRSFTLGMPVKTDQVRATYKAGVLEIHLPKAEEIKPRKVEVKVAE